MGLADRAKDAAAPATGRAGDALDRATDAAATGVEKVAGALDEMTAGLFQERFGETSGRLAETLRNVADPAGRAEGGPDAEAGPDADAGSDEQTGAG